MLRQRQPSGSTLQALMAMCIVIVNYLLFKQKQRPKITNLIDIDIAILTPSILIIVLLITSKRVMATRLISFSYQRWRTDGRSERPIKWVRGRGYPYFLHASWSDPASVWSCLVRVTPRGGRPLTRRVVFISELICRSLEEKFEGVKVWRL